LAIWRVKVVRWTRRREGREPLTVVPPEVGVKALLGVYPEELADDLDGQHLGVGEVGSRTAAAR
jgi:hypothetical protein